MAVEQPLGYLSLVIALIRKYFECVFCHFQPLRQFHAAEIGDGQEVEEVVRHREVVEGDGIDTEEILKLYEEELSKKPMDHKRWESYIEFVAWEGTMERIRELCERAILNVPHVEEKEHWQDYIQLWIEYAQYEETHGGDFERSQIVLRRCHDLIPHQKFSFANFWIAAAHFEGRHFGIEGTRDVFEKALSQTTLDDPLLVWKCYIRYEEEGGDVGKARALCERQLGQEKHLNVWFRYIEFDLRTLKLALLAEEKCSCVQRAREIFKRALDYYTSRPELNHEQDILIEKWLETEQSLGDVDLVQSWCQGPKDE